MYTISVSSITDCDPGLETVAREVRGAVGDSIPVREGVGNESVNVGTGVSCETGVQAEVVRTKIHAIWNISESFTTYFSIRDE
jgi:hypothetical protein